MFEIIEKEFLPDILIRETAPIPFADIGATIVSSRKEDFIYYSKFFI